MKKIRTFWQVVREFWKTGKIGVALFLISIFALIYGYIALEFEITQGWKGHVSVQNVTKDISAFIPVGAACVAMIIGGIDLIMLLSDFIQARREKQIEAAKEERQGRGLQRDRSVGSPAKRSGKSGRGVHRTPADKTAGTITEKTKRINLLPRFRPMNAGFYTIRNRTQTHVGIGKKPVQKVSRCLQRPFDSKRGPKSQFPRFLSDARLEKSQKPVMKRHLKVCCRNLAPF